MNKERRKRIDHVSGRLESLVYPIDTEELDILRSEVENILYDEEYAFESMPENLQDSERGMISQDAQSALDEAISLIDNLISEPDAVSGSTSDDEADNKSDNKPTSEDGTAGDATDNHADEIDVDGYIQEIVSYLTDATL